MAASETKTKLMDAAEQQVRHKGADGFSYSDLSQLVGIRKASIHYHFPTKADLLTAIMARYSKRIMTALEGYAQDLPGADQQLSDFIALYRDALQDGTALCLCVAYTVSQDSLSEGTHREIAQFRQQVRGWLEETFARAKAEGSVLGVTVPAHEAAAAYALVEGAQIAARISGDPATFDAATQALRERLIEAKA
ncbi:TetR/AcrR family transcriptional regulator [Ruegeria sp. 2205SS24-7]|uniref:TetR/AcrR family transcriptional regulator n=1 Tax=Ruegeria discodermiae TaxID=3064389 RepID=UPI002741ACB0|nr:TetR/AcrR family transcriptional regulator [Ruegeria sp. 2205SS24-7]MDP5217168.1 TetR/AcrR family transcriptional regulator [Ruegeria sp. 2205SS24-7]